MVGGFKALAALLCTVFYYTKGRESYNTAWCTAAARTVQVVGVLLTYGIVLLSCRYHYRSAHGYL